MNDSSVVPARWAYIPLAMAMSMVALSLSRLAYGLLLPFMRADLSLSFQQAGNLGTSTSFGYLLLVLPAGYLTRRIGPRRVIISGLTIVSMGFLGMMMTSAYAWLLLWMAALGTGTALIYTPVVSFIVGWFPNRRGLVLGLVNSGIGLGVFICGLAVPYMATADSDGWRQVWGLFAITSVLIGATAAWLIRNPPLRRSNTQITTSAAMTVYRLPTVQVLGACYFITGFSYIVQTVFMYSYALEAGVAENTAGAMASLAGMLSLFSGLLWGALSDYIGRGVALFFCFSGAAVATITPVWIPSDSGFLVHYVLSGLTVSGLFATIVAATSEQSDSANVPIAIGFVTTLFATGQLIGPAVAGWIIELNNSFRFAFILSATSMLVGAVLSLRLKKLNGYNRR
ncbi:MAG: MFS transporter [Pseudomonadota bacterium]